MAGLDAGCRQPSRALVTLASTAFSLLLHGAVLAAVAHWIEYDPGVIASPTEAVSLELLASEVLEAVTAAPSLEAAASPASVESDRGETVERAAASASAADQIRPVEPTEQVAARELAAAEADAVTPRGLEALQGVQESDQSVGVEEAPEPAVKKAEKLPRETEERKPPAKMAKLPDPSEIRKTESRPTKKGAASSRATKGSAGSAGRVSASTGSALNYAAIVRARVAARKPSGGGERGTVVIAFGVSRSGALSHASIARSSGNPGLDRRVLAAVRGAGPFPAPPPGASLRFAIPFHFR